MGNKSMQPCWTCKNYAYGCEWSDSRKPVKGWNAIPKIQKLDNREIQTYKILECPKYVEG